MLNIFCGGTLPLELQMMDEPAEAALQKNPQKLETKQKKHAASQRHPGSAPNEITPADRWQVPLSFCYII